MPFQAIAYARRVRTGTALSKLIWIELVGQSHLDGYVDIEVSDLVAFTHASPREVLDALAVLRSLGLIDWPQEHPDEWICAIVKLPLSEDHHSERKRPKLTSDQMRAIHTTRCPGCMRAQDDGSNEGSEDYYFSGEFHVDHIIPRAMGGADVEENLQLLCPRCNARKGRRAGWVNLL